MPVQRTDLRDELAALIAAGRELPPDHDQVLAEVFLDRLAAEVTPPSRTRQVLAALGKPRRLLGAAILGVMLLGGVAVESFHHAVLSGTNVQAQPAVLRCVVKQQSSVCFPVLKRVPVSPAKPQVPPVPKALPAPVPKALPAPLPKDGS